MKKQTMISIYNVLTVVFAILTVVSMGSVGSLPLQTVFTNIALFALLTYNCYDKENKLRAALKRQKRKTALAVYNAPDRRAA